MDSFAEWTIGIRGFRCFVSLLLLLPFDVAYTVARYLIVPTAHMSFFSTLSLC